MEFVSTFKRLCWEYNYINQTFVLQHGLLTTNNFVNEEMNPLHDIHIFGGSYPFSRGQVQALVDLIVKHPI